ncbi:MAG TPA: hypothetical protein VGF92_12185, partial [Stellaceae bacterium]
MAMPILPSCSTQTLGGRFVGGALEAAILKDYCARLGLAIIDKKLLGFGNFSCAAASSIASTAG